jgi:dipeptidyl aminopeptidase/acylaminoacyl peptidase
VSDALSWAATDLGAPVAVFGRSAGGYLALLCGTFPRRPSAIVSFYGYGSVLESWYTAPSPHYASQPPVSEEEALQSLGGIGVCTSATEKRWPFYLRARQKGTWPGIVGGADLRALHRFCPVECVDAGYPPAYLVHGKRDDDVPFESSVRMASALRTAGVPHELELVDDRGHAFDQDVDDPVTAGIYGRVLAFLAHHLAPGAA